jgi:hypothetical protein
MGWVALRLIKIFLGLSQNQNEKIKNKFTGIFHPDRAELEM